MENTLRKAVWSQFGAALDTFENTIELITPELWESEEHKLWYWSFHCLFFTDYYLSTEPKNFAPPAPFTMSEFERGKMPDRTYTKEEVQTYLKHCRNKCRDLMKDFDLDKANSPWIDQWKNFTLLEIMIYNARHIQHHAGQFNRLIRQETGEASPWVSFTKFEIES